MLEIILSGAIMISLMHALVPSHWLPLLTISKAKSWTKSETLRITLLAGLVHACSTILLGLIVSFLGEQLKHWFDSIFEIILPVCLILLGLFFLYRHHTHHHFHIDTDELQNQSNTSIIFYSILGMMFLSPCMEIVPYFLMAGAYGIPSLVLLSLIYLIVSVGGMWIWMSLMYRGSTVLNWHKIEHNAGLITGIVLIISGLVSLMGTH